MKIIRRFQEAARPVEKSEITIWVLKTLQLRVTTNQQSGRKSVPLSKAARAVLSSGKLSKNWFANFYIRHKEVHTTDVASRPLSMQRALGANPQQRDRLFDRRIKALLETNIFDPSTGLVDLTRIFNSDECPNPIDAIAKGNNKNLVHGT